ncbi:hypothetical protein NEOLEDRAFT_393332 [Neolentinus lepideus HHB14362 ss-1]|uniref:Uncharacterized protein n=1 Tax=Neolentinus lepideus HHB14362 ss-1 TaxID=1314782 RepID=A0A165S7Y4_9AGAM|nr:hypothetical protein NEOLEDRAFT_393332 [Neolentinus lepideus HHB14362 ss-1]
MWRPPLPSAHLLSGWRLRVQRVSVRFLGVTATFRLEYTSTSSTAAMTIHFDKSQDAGPHFPDAPGTKKADASSCHFRAVDRNIRDSSGNEDADVIPGPNANTFQRGHPRIDVKYRAPPDLNFRVRTSFHHLCRAFRG